MRALTIWQPFAGLIMAGMKPLENRVWAPKLKIGDRFAIHAGKDCDVEEWVEREMERELGHLGAKLCLVNGAILGTVRFMGVETDPAKFDAKARKWFVGPKGWLVDQPQVWKTPFKCKGALSLWEIPKEALQNA